tara:strand:+ start:283 stop:531 length:249 start_codon:yes stop_codon:yes gene_type:complete
MEKKEIKVLSISRVGPIEFGMYKVEVDDPWFFVTDSIISNTQESFTVVNEEVPNERGDWYMIKATQEISNKGLSMIKTLKLE